MDYMVVWGLAPVVLLLACYFGRRIEQSLNDGQEVKS
jgi:hypothetical protein